MAKDTANTKSFVLRVDSDTMDALEKWGAVENGKILSFPDLTEFLLKQLGRPHNYAQAQNAVQRIRRKVAKQFGVFSES